MDFVDPLSGLLWLITAFAAGLYPLGFMLGGSCSNCCASECEPLFYRCMRQKTTDGKAPPTPSITILKKAGAGVFKASSLASFTVDIEPNDTFWWLSAGERVTYSFDVIHSTNDSVWGKTLCDDTPPKLKITFAGRNVPLTFASPEYAGSFSGATAGTVTAQTRTLNDNGTGGATNYNFPATIEVVAADIVGTTERIDGAIVTASALRSMLTATLNTPTERRTTATLALNADLSGFRYIRFGDNVSLRWLIRTTRGGAREEFVVSMPVFATQGLVIPPGPLTPVSIPTLPDPQHAPGVYDYIPYETTQTGNDTEIVIYPRASNNLGSFYALGAREDRVTFVTPLNNRCRLGSLPVTNVFTYSFSLKTRTGPNRPYSPSLNPNIISSAGFTPTFSLDGWAYRHPDDATQRGGVYDTDTVEAFVRGETPLRTTIWKSQYRSSGSPTTTVDVLLVPPSPMCGLPACSLPKEFFPAGITYTPNPGMKWDCKPARTIVLGNSPDTPCSYTHSVNECRGQAAVYASATNFFKDWGGDNASLDALTWVEANLQSYRIEQSWINQANGALAGLYSPEGTYNPKDGRHGACYASDTLVVGNSSDGKCPPQEVKVKISNVRKTPDSPGRPSFNSDDVFEAIRGLEGTYSCSPRRLTDQYGASPCRASLFYQTADGTAPSFASEANFDPYAEVFYSHDACTRKWGGFVTQWTPAIDSYGNNTANRVWLSIPSQQEVDGVVSGTNNQSSALLFYASLWARGLGKDMTYRISFAYDYEITYSGNITQCTGVSFEPKSLTVESGSTGFLYGKPTFSGNAIKATGPWKPCGYGFGNYWNPFLGDNQDGGSGSGGSSYSGQVKSRSIALNPPLSGRQDLAYTPGNPDVDSEDVTTTVTLTSDGSDPTDIAVTVKGTCQYISTTLPRVLGFSAPVYSPVVAKGTTCVTVPIITGRSCAWTAVATGDVAIAPETDVGVGVGSVKVIKNGDKPLKGKVTVSLDAPAAGNRQWSSFQYLALRTYSQPITINVEELPY